METAQLKAKQIHAAVDEASGVLLQDMPYDMNKVSMLRDMGFTSSENVKDMDDHAANAHYAKLYRDKYPLYKFITTHQLTKIQKKYGLVEGKLGTFKGNIPEKNIKEMMCFQIDASDINEPTDPWQIAVKDIERMTNQIFNSFNLIDPGVTGMRPGADNGIPRRPSEIKGTWMDWIAGDRVSEAQAFREERRADIIGRATGKNSMSDYYRDKINDRLPNPKDYFDSQKGNDARSASNNRSPVKFNDIARAFPNALMITADKELFNIPDPELDPIVTVAVNGGYLVVTAWGAEANDPDVINPVMN